jgi:hypothetical protein
MPHTKHFVAACRCAVSNKGFAHHAGPFSKGYGADELIARGPGIHEGGLGAVSGCAVLREAGREKGRPAGADGALGPRLPRKRTLY